MATVNGEQPNRLDGAVFDKLVSRIESDEIAAAAMAPPCNSWPGALSNDRTGNDGPMALRGVGEHDLYGLPDLAREEKEKSRRERCMRLGVGQWQGYTE
jgi:hypothetical protein